MQVLFRTLFLQVVFIPKFTGHSRGLHTIGILSGTTILLAKMFDFLSNKEILKLCINYNLFTFNAHIQGESIFTSQSLFSSYSKTAISLSMPVLSTIVQKGGDCKSKVLPPCVLDIVGQNSRGTNNVFEYKQLLRFLKNKMIGRSSRQSVQEWRNYSLE